MVDPISYLTLSYSCEASVVDSGMLVAMIEKTQAVVGGKLERVLADGTYCTILDLSDAIERKIDLVAPVSDCKTQRCGTARNGEAQIPRDEFSYNAERNSFVCPQGHELPYKDREKVFRADGRFVYRSRYQCDVATCQACPLAERCLAGRGGRAIKRSEGEELLVAQKEKMETEEAKAYYALRGQSVELTFADAKGNRAHDRFHGRGLDRVRAETGLVILAKDLFRVDRLQRNTVTPEKQAA